MNHGPTAPAMTCGGISHVGGVRQVNEDAYLASERLCVVADGMGGHEAGEVASQLAVEVFSNAADRESLDVVDLEPLIREANDVIRSRGLEAGTEGMGTTLVGAALTSNGDSPSAVVFSIGDSRCYRLTNESFEQLTTDHSHVEELVAAGEITRQEAECHPLRNVVTRALGVDPSVRADFIVLADVSCRLLLCSDGLSGEVDVDTLRSVLSDSVDPQAAAAQLVDQALLGRAPDNITAVVIDLVFPDDQSDDTLLDRAVIDADVITAPRRPVRLPGTSDPDIISVDDIPREVPLS